VDKPADLDVATVMSMGFPPYKGGLIFWADLVGSPLVIACVHTVRRNSKEGTVVTG
jgi:hypothetical protein